jgi:hypothetical protein
MFHKGLPILGRRQAKIKALEKGSPAWFYTVGVLQILIIEFSEIGCMCGI